MLKPEVSNYIVVFMCAQFHMSKHWKGSLNTAIYVHILTYNTNMGNAKS